MVHQRTESMSVVAFATPKIPLKQWLQRSFLRTALIPLLAVEVILVIAFIVTHQISTSSQVTVQRHAAEENLERLVQSRAEILTQQLESVAIVTEMFRRQTTEALLTPAQASSVERSRYARTPQGAYVTTADVGGAAAFYSNITPLGKPQFQQIWRTAQLDPLMRDLVNSHPLITQVYFNSHDSYNRIYPYFDAATQYPPELNIPSYNFYYLADAQHNPERDVTWTDAYLDPAGQGWMLSCIAPVYQQDFLAGVVGSDITLEVLIKQVLAHKVPWNGYSLLLAKDGTLLAMPAAAEQEWGLREKTNHHYTDFVREDIFKPEEFNLFRRPELENLSTEIQQEFSAVRGLELEGVKKLAAWSHIPETGWTYLVVVPEAEVFLQTQQLGDRLLLLGKIMILGMIVFYTLFLAYLFRSGKRMGQQVAEPLHEIEKLVDAIATSSYYQPKPEILIAELDQAAARVVEMGYTLGDRTDALMRALKVKSDFLGIVSHELRTPMNGILGMGDLLRLTELTPLQRDYLNAMLSSGENLLRLLNDILDMSRLEAKGLTLCLEVVELTELLREQFNLWQPQAQQKGVTFVLEVAADLPQQVMADRARLRQMLNNYLNNALKFTSTGQICLQVSRIQPTDGDRPLDAGGSLLLNGNPPDTADSPSEELQSNRCCLRFAVIDTGIGIAPAHLSQLFLPFSQVDHSLQRSFEGAGLGLSIVKQLALLMEGDVGVESIEGSGSIFWFEIPLKVVEAGLLGSVMPTIATTSFIENDLLRVLVAENNRANQQFALLCLKKIHALCDLAMDGEEAIALFSKAPYDLVLMDIHMPGVDGITAMKEMRRQCPHAVIVAITDDALPETRDRLLQEGFTAFLPKPFQLKDIMALLEQVMLARKAEPGIAEPQASTVSEYNALR